MSPQPRIFIPVFTALTASLSTCECLHEHGDYILEKQIVKDIRGLLYKSNEYLTGSKVEEKLPTTAINLLVNSFL